VTRPALLFYRVLARVWHRLAGPLQWRALWLSQATFMVAVGGVVFDERDRVLLLRHRFWPEGSWGLPGGYAHRGERLEAALARELREETGAELAHVRLLAVASGYRLRVEVFYSARLAGGLGRLDPAEILAADLFPADALPAGLLRDHRDLVARAVAARAGHG
jgi:ADP-ribose pyrophosphatase YjhB (NUDIX family)